MKWTEEQYTAIYARGKRLLVSAAAGSGKTAVLVERVLSRITRENEPDSLDKLVILTFTNAAASEMRSRIADAISAKLALDPKNRLLRGQLNRVQTARIMTVHAFCAGLVRENFHALGISPEFRIISGEEEETLRLETLSAWLEGEYASAGEDSPFWELAENASSARDDSGLKALILSIAGILRNDPDPEGFADGLSRGAAVAPDADAAETVWGRIYLERVRRDLEFAACLYERCEKIASGNPVDGAAPKAISQEADGVRQLAAVKGGWEDWRGALGGFKTSVMRFGKNTPDNIKEELKLLRGMGKDIVTALTKGMLAYPNRAVIEDINENAPFIRELLRLARGFMDAWWQRKLELGVLGFDDLEHCALRVLSEKTGEGRAPSALALEYGRDIREIMVDEYQDTNGLQDEIFKCLAAGGAELFVVGDVKQSIYRFRNAEPEIFLARRRRGRVAENLAPGAGETALASEDNTVIMRKNFRSLPGVTESVNGVFRVLMTESLGEMDYLPADELVACRESDGQDNITEFDLIEGEEEDGDDGEESRSAREKEAAWVAERIASLLKSGRTVFDKSVGGERPIVPGDIAVLVRSAKRRISVLAEAIGARGIPVNTDAGGDVFATAEVMAVMCMLSAVDNPGRELSLVGYLRSPLEGFTPDDLGRVRLAGRGMSFYSAMKLCAEGLGETADKCRSALARLERMRLGVSDMDVGRAVGMLLDMSGAFVVFGSMEGGAARRANLNLIMGLASSYSARSGGDLGGFVKSLERSRDRGDEFAPSASGAQGVRIMTVHASKGLEFPVVILANSMDRLNIGWKRENVLVHRDSGIGMMYTSPGQFFRRTTLPREAAAARIGRQQIAEELRLLYVAMTRARDKLIITGSCADGDGLLGEVASDGSAAWVEGVCTAKPSFGRWVLAAMAANGDIPIRLNRISGVSEGEVLAGGENENTAAAEAELVAEIEKRVGFVYPHAASAMMPAKMTATGYNGLVELAGESLKVTGDIVLPTFLDSRGDMTAAERGVAAHLAMQLLPPRKYLSAGDAVGEIEKLIASGVLTRRQSTAVSGESVKAFYDSELGSRALDGTNRSVRREFKFSILAPAERFAGPDAAGEEILLQGVIDLFWIRGDGSVELADYKTDNIRPGEELARAESYRSQLEVYRYALGEMLGAEVKRVYIWFFKTQKAVRLDFEDPA
ncbi:MAG: hypothetical protein E7460_07580 [Ruminococcaceae bacterium]|nr:hypothetical protein [Oscillospiraceae bacterium]